MCTVALSSDMFEARASLNLEPSCLEDMQMISVGRTTRVSDNFSRSLEPNGCTPNQWFVTRCDGEICTPPARSVNATHLRVECTPSHPRPAGKPQKTPFTSALVATPTLPTAAVATSASRHCQTCCLAARSRNGWLSWRSLIPARSRCAKSPSSTAGVWRHALKRAHAIIPRRQLQ